MKPKISIIIVNWNVCELLKDCLQSVYKYINTETYEIDVIVVDNASADNSVEMIRSQYPQVNLIPCDRNWGFGKANNIGLLQAKGDYILLLNPDTEFKDDFIDYCFKSLISDNSIAVLGCRMVTQNGEFRRDAGGYFPSLMNVAWNYLFLNKIFPASISPAPFYLESDTQGRLEVDWISGADLFIRKDRIPNQQLFDERYFMYGEDLDLCYRVKKKGYKLIYDSGRTILHHQGKSFEKQSDAILLTSIHKGPRMFFLETHGSIKTFFYDLILLTGFSLRWPCYYLGSIITGKPGLRERANFSKRYLGIILGLIFSHNQSTKK